MPAGALFVFSAAEPLSRYEKAAPRKDGAEGPRSLSNLYCRPFTPRAAGMPPSSSPVGMALGDSGHQGSALARVKLADNFQNLGQQRKHRSPGSGGGGVPFIFWLAS